MVTKTTTPTLTAADTTADPDTAPEADTVSDYTPVVGDLVQDDNQRLGFVAGTDDEAGPSVVWLGQAAPYGLTLTKV